MSFLKAALALLPLLALGLWLIRRDRRQREAYRRLSMMALRARGPGTWIKELHRDLLSPPENRAALAVLAGSVAVLVLLGIPGILAAASALALAFLTRLVVRGRRLRVIRARFAEAFPEAVSALARAVQAGVPVERALASIADLSQGELSGRFRQLVLHLELGVPFRDALDVFRAELGLPDVDFFCSILALNRESGSRLSPMLVSLRQTLRDRQAVDRKLRALTSESRSAARILTALPFFVIGLQAFLNPKQVAFLLSDPAGRTVLAVCAVMMWLGLMTIRRMSRLASGQ
jgi:tight adherence protein B